MKIKTLTTTFLLLLFVIITIGAQDRITAVNINIETPAVGSSAMDEVVIK